MLIETRDLEPHMNDEGDQAARILMVAFRELSPGSWETYPEAIEEIQALQQPGHVLRIAIAEGRVVGLIGGISTYNGRVWELHPLAVLPAWQGRGVGRTLVRDLERQVAARGGLTITLGSDDVSGMTSLAGADLYVDTWEQVRTIRNLRRHPYEFYQKMGFVITGVVPDANGVGKPDIILSKRVTAEPA
jgi:aminoglycoside 6'-N-acetyltransferase I